MLPTVRWESHCLVRNVTSVGSSVPPLTLLLISCPSPISNYQAQSLNNFPNNFKKTFWSMERSVTFIRRLDLSEVNGNHLNTGKKRTQNRQEAILRLKDRN